jgi:hypothetical protein
MYINDKLLLMSCFFPEECKVGVFHFKHFRK